MIEKNKSVIITGANKGIGFATTKKFIKNGYKVFFCSRLEKLAKAQGIQSFTEEENERIIPIYFDLNDENSLIDAAKKIKDTDIEIEALINNAGTISTNLFLMTKIEEMKKMFNTNFFSTLFFTQQIVKIFMRQKKGNIINVSSTASQDPVPGRVVYSSIKASYNISSQILSKELASFNIRVNAIAPGLTDTDLMNNNHTSDNIKKTIENINLKRIAKPNEIADVIYFLASEESSYINGQVIRVDGGM